MEPTGNAFDIAAAATVAREGWTSDADQSELYAMLFDGAGGDGTDGDVAQAWKDSLVALADAVFAEEAAATERHGASSADAVAWFEPFLNLVTDVCWKARERCLGRHEPERVRRHGSIGKPHLPYLTTALIELQLYRFDFNYEGIYEVLSRADDAPLQLSLIHI